MRDECSLAEARAAGRGRLRRRPRDAADATARGGRSADGGGLHVPGAGAQTDPGERTRVRAAPAGSVGLASAGTGPPTPERGTRDYFAVLVMQVEAVDWLELHASGHRRAAFDAAGRRWLAP